MRLSTIEEVRNVKDSIQESYVTSELSGVKLGSRIGEIALGGREHKLSREGIYQMCRVLGVPYSFARTLSERMPDVWQDLSSRLVSQSYRKVTFKVDPESSNVIGLFQARDDYVSIKRFLEITEMLYRKVASAAGVDNIRVDINDESSSAFFYTPKEFSPIKTNSNDLFKYGIGFSASSLEIHSPSISESLFRLICSNLTYAPSHGGVVFRSRDQERVLNAADFILKEPERVSRYPEILNSLTEKKLSYRELESAHSYIARIKDAEGEVLVPDLEKRIPLLRVAGAYGYENFDSVPDSPSWKSSAKTPITPYEVFNHLTEIGSHYNHIPDRERINILIYAGNLMFKESWDVDSLAPQIDFSDWEIPKQHRVLNS
ncbi:MAG TPA: hypothetical protein VHT73_12935 [Thermodesulfobacteriota bacterium]|nr:hypothetical protein [Thermodesulfobacteriota bacterium]